MKSIFSLLLLILLPFTFIYSQNIKVSDPIKLLSNPNEYYNSPVSSPDGSKIAFTSSNYKGIYIYSVSNQTISKITDEDAAGFGFTWDNSSNYILSKPAVYINGNRLNSIKLYDINSLESKQISDSRYLMPGLPGFTPDNTSIYFCSRGILESFNSGLSARQNNNLTGNFAFIKDDKVAVSNNKNSAKTFELFPSEKVINLSLSPDGNKVVFEVIGGNMFSMNVNGSNLTDLGEGHRPKWSPDSKHIVYIITKDDGYNYTSSDIYVINSDASGKQNLTDSNDIIEMNPSFTPDNKSILFDVANEGSIYSMNILFN